MRDHLEVPLERQGVVAHPDAFVGGIQSGLQPAILRRHARRARVGVAAQRLNAPDREKKSATDVNQVGAKRKVRGDVAAGGDLSGGDEGDVIAQPFATERVVVTCSVRERSYDGSLSKTD